MRPYLPRAKSRLTADQVAGKEHIDKQPFLRAGGALFLCRISGSVIRQGGTQVPHGSQ